MSGYVFVKLLAIMTFVTVLPFAHQGLYDGYRAVSEQEAGMDPRERGLVMWNVYDDFGDSDLSEDAPGSVKRTVWLSEQMPEPDGPPPLAVGLIRLSFDLYDRVALFAYQNRPWLSKTAIDTAFLTVYSAFFAGWGFKYRHFLRWTARRAVGR